DGGAAFIPTLRENRSEADALTMAIAHAHASGAKIEWEAFFKETGERRVPLPTYPFQRKRYWLASTSGAGDIGAAGLGDPEHPLLAATIEDPNDGGLTLTGRLSLATHPWLADDAVYGVFLLPGTAFVELALRAAEQVDAATVEELTLQAPLILPETGAVAIQVTVSGPGGEGRGETAIHSRSEGGRDGELREAPECTCPATGVLSDLPVSPPEPFDTWPPEGAEPLEIDYLYDRLAEHGFEYGPAFRGLSAAWRDGEQIYAEVSLPEEHAREAARFGVHPALFDSAFHAGIDLALSSGGEGPEAGGLSLPFAWRGVRVA